MGGMLGVASSLKKGTLFFLAVPLTVAVDCHDFSPRKLVSSSSSLSLSLADMDDDDGMSSPICVLEKSTPRSRSPLSSPLKKLNEMSLTIKKDSLFLLVDDSQINLRLAKRKIQLALGKDIMIMTAEDGLDGIAAYEQLIATDKQHLLCGIFMDYHMPRCSGAEAMRAIRKIEKLHSPSLTPCHMIAFTADVSDTSKSQLMEAGANEVMAKPTPAGQLEDACVRLASKVAQR